MSDPTSWATSTSWGGESILTTRDGWDLAAVSVHVGWFQRWVEYAWKWRKAKNNSSQFCHFSLFCHTKETKYVFNIGILKYWNYQLTVVFHSASIEAPTDCASLRSPTLAVTWWSSWMIVPVCLTVSTTATSTPVMLWMATGSSTSTPTTEADSTSWELGSTGGIATGAPPVPSLAPLGGSPSFSH